MNWKLKFLVAVAIVVCGAIFIKLPTQAQKNPTQMSSETVENALEQYPGEVKTAPENNLAVTTFSYTGPAVAIPDNIATGVNVPLTVSGIGSITDLNFRLDSLAGCSTTVNDTNASVDHTFLSDLSFKLTSPAGTAVNLITARGGSGDNYCTVLLDDDGGFPAASTIPTTGAVAGNFAPESPLSAFDGQNPNGVWQLNVSDNAGLDTGSLRRFSLVITDAGVILPSLAINDVAVTEGNSGTTNANFTVTLSAASTTAVTVNYATADQTATAPSDYTATSGTLTFAPGVLTQTISVPVVGDTTFEPNETFAVNLSAVSSNATILDNQGIGTITNDDVSTAPACVFNNGGLNPQAVAENGTAAPTGKFWSEVQHDAGNTTVSNTVAGFSPLQGTSRLADNFTVPAGGCTLNTVTFFAYQTGSAATPSPFSAYTLQIWNGRPGDAGATVVFGDTTTNRLASSVDSNIFRIFNTVVPTATPTGTTRIIWRNTLNVGTTLAAGTYWLDWASTATNGGAHFQPSKTIAGSRGAAGDNARQLTVATGVWIDVVDTGNPVTTPSVPQDFPFYLNNLVTNNAPVDFNGDGKTDFVVVRNVGVGASGATNQLRWFYNINGSSVPTAASDWGVSTDALTPVDFDGDGKDDIAVWRPAAATTAAFYILQSGTNTLRVDRFGQTGDDPSVVGDYDGDGKADPAVYRAGATPTAQSVWYYRGSFNNPSGNITFLPWGLGDDFPSPGDFDGDGKMDVNIQRSGATGQGLFIARRSSDGTATYTNFGLPTDFTVPGDYDGDGKTDLAVRRTIGGVHNYFILQSSNGVVRYVQFGATGFRTVQGDYDGDGKTDVASWQPATGTFWIIQSSNGATTAFQLGASGDAPAAGYNTH